MKNKLKHKVGDIVDDIFEITPLSMFEKIKSYPLWIWQDFSYWIRRKFQKLKYGFELRESYDFYNHLPNHILPRLKHLRENLHSHPSSLSSIEEWRFILDKIIWSFQNINTDTTDLWVYPENYDNRWKVVKVGESIGYGKVDERNIDFSKEIEFKKRIQGGLDLFSKHYFDLWD